jgi:hypothetical protein
MNLLRPSSKKFGRLIRKIVDGAGGNPAAQVETDSNRGNGSGGFACKRRGRDSHRIEESYVVFFCVNEEEFSFLHPRLF